MAESLFRAEEEALIPTTKRRNLLRLSPGRWEDVQVGAAQWSRTLVPVHYDCEQGRSVRCQNSHCELCKQGKESRLYLYLAARTLRGREVVVCVSGTVSCKWLEKRPDFHKSFRVERDVKQHGPTLLTQNDLSIKFPTEWEGFDVSRELEWIFRGR